MSDVNSFIDLSEETDEFVFPFPPSAVWLIFSLEFPTIFQDRKYLLTTQPYYGDSQSKINFGEGIWYPPFSAFPVDLRYFPTRTLGDVRVKLAEMEENKFHTEFIDEIAYNLGLGEPKYEKVDQPPVDEYKLSPRSHNVYKFFRLVRYRCWHPAESGKRNLADPESVKGLCYIPMDLESEKYRSSNLGPHSHRFFSRVVATHFSKSTKTYLNERSKDKYTELGVSDLVCSEKGHLLFFDVSGFGKTEAATRERSFHPTETSSAVAESFRTILSRIFLNFFQELGISQYVTLGDGFIAGAPDRIFESDNHFFERLSDATHELSLALAEINVLLKNSGEALGLRASVVKGEYRYGRIGGLSSLRSEFDGTILIDAARLDAGTKEALSPEQRKNHVVVSGYTQDQLDWPFIGHSETKEFKVAVKEKEAQAFMKVMHFDEVKS